MKKFIKSKSFTNTLGGLLICFAGVVSCSTCFFFIGEPVPPKSLLK